MSRSDNNMSNRWLPAWGQGITGLLTSLVLSRWMRTLDYKTIYQDPALDPAITRPSARRFVYVFWHEYILLPLYLRGHCDLCMLVSSHHGTNVLCRVARHWGFDVVRGSSNRDPIRGTRDMIRSGWSRHLTLTPDGPRGPRREFSPGAIVMASRLGIPIVCLGFGVDRAWRLSSWDRFAIPRPYARARCVMSAPLEVPPGLSSTAREHYRVRAASLLEVVTAQAETWAQSRSSHPQQVATIREPRRCA